MRDKILSTHVTVIFGKRGAGKSTICKEIQKAMPRLVVVDLMREYQVDPADPADFEAVSIEGLARVLIAITAQGLEQFRVVFRWPRGADVSEEEANKVFHLIYEFRDVCLVLEEVHHYMRREWMPTWLKNLALLGRHQGVGLIATSQRPAEVSKTFVSQADHAFVARSFEKNDVKYYLSSFEVTEVQLRTLEQYEFLRFHHGRLRGRVKASP